MGWGVVITIGVCIFSEVTRDNLVAILKGELTYEEVVLESETKEGYTFGESLRSLLGDYNINTFYTNEKVPVVEVKGQCTVMALIRLKLHKKEQSKHKLSLGDIYNSNVYVFADELGNPIDDKRSGRNLKATS